VQVPSRRTLSRTLPRKRRSRPMCACYRQQEAVSRQSASRLPTDRPRGVVGLQPWPRSRSGSQQEAVDIDPVAQAEVPRPKGALDFTTVSYTLSFCDLGEAVVSRHRILSLRHYRRLTILIVKLSLFPTVER